jgi:TRAP-type C4-dicarboxylate transport system substrate-binding protein
MKKMFLIGLVVVIAAVLLPSCSQGATSTATPATTTPLAATTTTVADTGQTYELKMAIHVATKASIVPAYYQPWADAVKAATNGRVNITIYPEETLVKEADQYDAVVSGLADIAACAPDANPGRFSLAEVVELPLLFPNQKVGAQAAWDILNTLSADAYKDVVVLGVAVISPAEYFGNKEVKVPSDLKGMRMRSGGKVESWVLQATGATPVDIETGDLATSVERGLVDGTFLSWSFGIVTGVKDLTKYRTKVDLFYRAFVIVMNKDKFNSMPKVLQDAIWSVSGQTASANYSAAEEAASAGAVRGVGGTVYTPTAAELNQWKVALTPVWDEWVKDTGGSAQAVLDKVKELSQKYSTQ